MTLPGQSGEHLDLNVSRNRLGLAFGIPLFAFGALGTYGGVRLLVSAPGAEDSLAKGMVQGLIGPMLLVVGGVCLVAGAVLPFVDTGTTVSQSVSPAAEATTEKGHRPRLRTGADVVGPSR